MGVECGKCIVALIDMLGARTTSEEGTTRSYDRMLFLRQRMEFRTHDMIRQGTSPPTDVIGHLPPPQLTAFGDCLLFVWKVGEEAKWLPVVGQLLADVFVDALENQTAFRGAVSYGWVQYDSAVALGPAISDAAEWYDKVEALAVVATPRTGLLLEDIERQMGAERLARAFVRHAEFELKGQTGKNALWTVAWPGTLYAHATHSANLGHNMRQTVLFWLRQFPMPYGTERRYYKALEIFDDYVAKWPRPGSPQGAPGTSVSPG